MYRRQTGNKPTQSSSSFLSPGADESRRGSLSKLKGRTKRVASALLVRAGAPLLLAATLLVSLPLLSFLRVSHHVVVSSSSDKGGGGGSSSNANSTRGTVESVREEFYRRYGGKAAAEAMLERGVQAYGKVEKTAERMLRAAADGVPFVLSFAGYSVTVGRGNYLHQAFPAVLGDVLTPLLQSELGVPVTVRNAAIGGIPSFPYGFCFEHFLGDDANVISWDYSMNEGKGASVLESYLRQSQSQLRRQRPMVIVLDTNKARCQLLRTYAQLGLIQDAMCVGKAENVLDKSLQNELKSESKEKGIERPVGFQEWNEFGAPPSCPGKGSWHPKRKEHELIGWIMAMYFVGAVEKALDIMKEDPNWKVTYGNSHDEVATSSVAFPAPLGGSLPDNDPQVTRLLYGHNEGNSDRYLMKHVSCRTSFLPAIDQDKVIPSVIVSGWNEAEGTENILSDRSDAAYKSGWVLDVSKVERETKLKVEGESCGGLGYVDMKIALYGIPESGKLRLWLPAHGNSNDKEGGDKSPASEWFTSLIICEANEKRPKDACQLDSDVRYTVGGVAASTTKMVAGAAEYLKRRTCVSVDIPKDAKVTSIEELRSAKENAPIPLDVKSRLLAGKEQQKQPLVGLVVDIEITGQVTRKDGACCISHVVWENE